MGDSSVAVPDFFLSVSHGCLDVQLQLAKLIKVVKFTAQLVVDAVELFAFAEIHDYRTRELLLDISIGKKSDAVVTCRVLYHSILFCHLCFLAAVAELFNGFRTLFGLLDHRVILEVSRKLSIERVGLVAKLPQRY